jgi:hypothetical protein
METSGDLEYTARAFGQDANEAMRSDVLRGLVELITNSDDAYRGKPGQITIAIKSAPEGFKAIISVSDKAGGLEGEMMKKSFVKLGAVNEAAPEGEGFGARGLFGRGAKDVAVLGGARFVSIKNGKFTDLVIDPKTAKFAMSRVNDEAAAADYQACLLNQGESGLTAEIFVANANQMPTTNALIEKLQTNVQLRDLINRNTVKLVDQSGKETVLHGMEPVGEKVIDVVLDLGSQYSSKAHLVLYRMESKVMSALSEYSQHGLVVSVRGAVYENTFLTLSGKAEAGWFCGRLDAPEIYDLSRSFDTKGANELNPFRVISRRRDGLERSHPYYRALAAAAEKHLRPVFEEAAKSEGASKREGETLKKKIESISQVLGSTLQQILNEDNSGELPSIADWDGDNFQMSIIPPKRTMHVGDEVTLSIRVPKGIDTEKIELDIIEEVKTLAFTSPVKGLTWREHERLPVSTATVKVKAENLGQGFVRVVNGNKTAIAEINILLFDKDRETVCKSLEFSPGKYTSSPGKSRNLLLRAPIENAGEEVALTYTGNASDGPVKVILKPAVSGKAAVAVVNVSVGDALGIIKVQAKLNEETTEAQIEVRESASGMIPKIDVVFAGNENPPRRVDTIPEDGKLVIKIYARHTSLSQIFGKHTGNGFEHEDAESALATTAEIVASQLAIYAVEQDAARNPIRYQDASSYFFRQQELVSRMVVAAQTGLLA